MPITKVHSNIYLDNILCHLENEEIVTFTFSFVVVSSHFYKEEKTSPVFLILLARAKVSLDSI